MLTYAVEGDIAGDPDAQYVTRLGRVADEDVPVIEVLVGTVLVSGVVRGTVRVAQRVQLAPTAKVYADLHTPSLVIEEGATFEGTCTMTREAAARDAGPQLVQRVSAGGERPA